jgi:hypothetical protein
LLMLPLRKRTKRSPPQQRSWKATIDHDIAEIKKRKEGTHEVVDGPRWPRARGMTAVRGWRPGLKNDLAVSIDNAYMRLFHSDVQSSAFVCSPHQESSSRHHSDSR